MDVRIVGVIEAEQTDGKKTEKNDRLLGVAVRSYDHEGIHNAGKNSGLGELRVPRLP